MFAEDVAAVPKIIIVIVSGVSCMCVFVLDGGVGATLLLSAHRQREQSFVRCDRQTSDPPVSTQVHTTRSTTPAKNTPAFLDRIIQPCTRLCCASLLLRSTTDLVPPCDDDPPRTTTMIVVVVVIFVVFREAYQTTRALGRIVQLERGTRCPTQTQHRQGT